MSNYVSLVELATTTVKNRQNKKCRITLMISDTSVELLINKLVSLILLMCVQKLKFTYSQKLFTVGLDQVVTCFSLPSEPRAFALVYKRDSAGGYCCASLMLNDALTSLTVCRMDWQSITVSLTLFFIQGWKVWEILVRKQLFFTVSESNRRVS